MLSKLTLLALLGVSSLAGAEYAKTTRYWDCCKGSCAWSGKAPVSAPLRTCNRDDTPLNNPDEKSGCDGGGAFMCTNQSPWVDPGDPNHSFGFAAVKLNGQGEGDWCCGCYELTFTNGPIAGKRMTVQATNTGGDLGNSHFDLQIPGGGVGLFNGCDDQWGAPPTGWGAQYGGVGSRGECEQLPAALKPGCFWRFDWFGGADNPDVDFKPVACPNQLIERTGCRRN